MHISFTVLQKITKAALAIVLVVQISAPVSASAATVSAEYQPSSVTELIAYLYGIIASLEAQLGALENPGTGSGSVTNTRSNGVETLTAGSIERDEARLRGSLGTITSDYVLAYFEYGRSRSTLNEETDTKRFSRSYRGTFTDDIEDLRSDTTYYYRAVLQSPNGKKVYGSVKSFTTDDERSTSNGRGDELDFNKSTYDAGELITLDLDFDTDLFPGAWIGLYEADEKNNGAYASWQYVWEDSDTLEFTAPSERGEYEFRLFVDSGYDDAAQSDTFEVR